MEKFYQAADLGMGIGGLCATVVGGILCFTPLAPAGAAILTTTGTVLNLKTSCAQQLSQHPMV